MSGGETLARLSRSGERLFFMCPGCRCGHSLQRRTREAGGRVCSAGVDLERGHGAADVCAVAAMQRVGAGGGPVPLHDVAPLSSAREGRQDQISR